MTDWDNIVGEHGPLVWRTAFRLLGNEADAADCYQEVFAAALEFSRRNEVAHWAGLLWKLATNQALTRLRQRGRDGRRKDLTATATPLDEFASALPDPSQVAEQRELADWLRATLARLPTQQAQAFWLTAIEHASYDEAAAQMNVEASHLGVLVHRARARLRELSADLEHENINPR